MISNKAERTAAITRSIASGKRAPLASFDSRKYIQHNLNIGDGLGPILEFMDGLPAGRVRAEVLRSFEDQEYSVVHADYELGDWGAMVGFEVHRWENDRIVEHWDNLAAIPSGPNSSGHTVIDGEATLSDIDCTEENRRVVELFAEEILLQRQSGKLSSFLFEGNLIQHSPCYGDGLQAFQEHMATWGPGGPQYNRVHKILGKGNMFLVMSEGTICEKPAALYDLYRLSGGSVVEHWEIFEVIPPREQWANQNGKF